MADEEEMVPLLLTFQRIFDLRPWKEIKNCPGRFVLKKNSGNGCHLDPLSFLLQILLSSEEDQQSSHKKILVDEIANEVKVLEVQTESLSDRLLLVCFRDGGGFLTYHKENGDFVHTLNNPSGFARKLTALKISFQKPSHPNEEEAQNQQQQSLSLRIESPFQIFQRTLSPKVDDSSGS